MTAPTLIQLIGTALFGIAVLHTFSTKWFQHLAHTQPRFAGVWHLLGEVEVVFGLWAMVLVLCIAGLAGPTDAITYIEEQNFTEPLFVFVILVIAGTRPILVLTQGLVESLTRWLPLPASFACYVLTLALIPLLGSFITEPAAMTLAALMLRERYYIRGMSARFMYGTLAVLLVNVSIGGVLTPYAAPPVLMVADAWGWDLAFMSSMFGWKAAIAVVFNAIGVALLFRKELAALPVPVVAPVSAPMPVAMILVHVLFLAGVVLTSHHPVAFLGLFLFFLGFTEAFEKHQDTLMLREGLLVGFFLAGLVVLGKQQTWWLQPILAGLDATVLFFGAVGLTAITDNAALTYLGSLVDGMSDTAKYALVAGAITGGGLTVIANAPNPAAFSILQDSFDEQSINPLQLFLSALVPTMVAGLCFMVL
ncbi:putative Na+/H+ antiporter [Actimicrobium antarcticum]|uniref:Na+/H+ antiporter n=1 Tax=Actimicrobium antarcticum TaxID=1051899 RepID=A0ABP7SJP8_9BURK